jgi:hypothetical protein
MKVVISTIVARAELKAPHERPEKARFRGVTVNPSRGGEAIVERVGPRLSQPVRQGEALEERREAGRVGG